MSKLSKSEFDSIVDSVAGDMPKVLKVSCFGFEVEVTFESNSGKSDWNSFFRFDEGTGNFTCHSTYSYAGLNREFGDRVSSRIKEILNS